MSRQISPSEYEALVAKLVGSIPASAQIAQIGSGARNRLRGLSGVGHQVDVSFVDEGVNPRRLVIVECKYIDKPIKLEHVKVLKATLDELRQGPDNPGECRAIMVSRHPLQRGAAEFARFYGIECRKIDDTESFSFMYANHGLLGAAMTAKSEITCSIRAVQPCRICGKPFEFVGDKPECDECTSGQAIRT